MIACKDLSLRSFGKLFTWGRGNNNSCELAPLLSAGNIKIPSTTAIFNMSPAHTCPSKKLGLCSAKKQGVKCYAIKAEYSYHPDVLPYRQKQEAFWHKTDAKTFVSQFLLLNALKKRQFQNIRFNESGDFHTQDCVNKAEEIAMHLRRFGIRCYCYTSRSDLNFSKCRHLIVSGSNFTKRGISNSVRIVGNFKERRKGESVCKASCKICRYCLMRNMKIIIKRH